MSSLKPALGLFPHPIPSPRAPGPHGPRRAWSRWVATWRKWSRRAIGGAVDTPPRIPWGWHGLNKFGYLKMMCHEIYTVYCILYVISNFTYVFVDIWYIYININILYIQGIGPYSLMSWEVVRYPLCRGEVDARHMLSIILCWRLEVYDPSPIGMMVS